MPTDVVLLLSTFPDAETARRATRALVEEKFVACGNLLPGVESIYTWKGALEVSMEVQVFYKTTAPFAQRAMTRLRELHPYDVPEILQVNVEDGWPDYLAWVGESVRRST
jgi:periplasmic divalent cation tolerance protein